MPHLVYRIRESRIVASDIMSSPVISIGPRMQVARIAALLRERRITGVPVLLGDQLVGIVTGKDLLHRVELGTVRLGRPPAWWRPGAAARLAPDRYIKSHGRYAQHVMSRRVVIATPQTPIHVITSLFDQFRIGRLPILSGNHLVGIVTCADLVQALATAPDDVARQEGMPGDQALQQHLLCELNGQSWWDGRLANVAVVGGVVRFSGFVQNESQRLASCIAAENVAGVRSVEDTRILAPDLSIIM